jgi:hypothetical protein
MKLSKSETFLKEVAAYKSKIESVTDEKIKKDLSLTLGKLIQEVTYIDQQHDELSIQKRLPETVNNSRSSIGNYRKKLNRTIELWNDHQKSKRIT